MSGFLTRLFLTPLILTVLALPALAQSPADAPVVIPSDRDASFLPGAPSGVGAISVPAFSGLAAPVDAPVVIPTPAPASPIAPTTPPLVAGAPVLVFPLPAVSPETIGAPSAVSGGDGFNAAMWKDTPRPVAEHLLAIVAPTSSPVLNSLTKRLLLAEAIPPEGNADSAQSLVAMRVDRLDALGAAAEGWMLAQRAEVKLVDDITLHNAVENLLAIGGGDDLCPRMPDLAKAHPNADWQKALVICQLRAKDTKAAQVSLDVMRTQNNRDTIFLEIADKNVMTAGKMLPFQLTPLSPTTIALLRLTGLAMPGELYGHLDMSLAPALLRLPAKQDVAQLGLAERAAARGLIGSDDIEVIYRSVVFTPDQMVSPMAAHEAGVRERALYFRAAEAEKDPAKRIAYAVKFMQSASPEFLNGAGAVVAVMLGDVKPDPALAENALAVTRAYMMAGKGDAALEWLRLAKSTIASADDLQNLWPQLVLAGLEADSDYAADFDKWLGAALKTADPQGDPRPARDGAAAAMLLLDAAGFKVPAAAWSQVLVAPHNEKHIAFSPVLFDRLQTAGANNRRAETILLAMGLAGDNDIALPEAAAITRALRQAGFKSEAATFAWQILALSGKN